MSNWYAVNEQGANFPSKKALREAVEKNPDSVRVFCTSAFHLNPGGTFKEVFENHLSLGTEVIVGPDPYNRRSWFANPAKRKDGSLTIK